MTKSIIVFACCYVQLSYDTNLIELFCCSVAQAYVNQKKLDTETKILHANVTHFAKQTTLWLKLVEDFNQALKVCC